MILVFMKSIYFEVFTDKKGFGNDIICTSFGNYLSPNEMIDVCL